MDVHQHSYWSETTLEKLTEENGNEDYVKISSKAAEDLSKKQLTFLEVVDKLKCLLLSHLPEKRRMGVLILSEILSLVDSDCLNFQELPVISAYFCEKLKDHHEVVAASFKGTLALVSNKSTPDESVVNLLNTIFNQVACQQQLQTDRLLIYRILEATLSQHLDVVNSMGIDFVYGVITLIDGERDPKNLIYLFNWLPQFLSVAKLEHLTEEMFDVLACYFPIDFKPPQNDTHKITRESLAETLSKCLTCIPDFGQFGIPLALEKLDTSLNIAIEDSLDILGCSNYSVEIYYQHSIEIWSQLQKKIFSSSDINISNKCLSTLQRVMGKLATGDAKNFENLVTDITDTLKGNMLPDSKLFTQSSQILIKVAEASSVSALLVAKHVCPLLENTFKIETNPKHKALILHNFVYFTKTAVESSLTDDTISLVSNGSALCSQAIVCDDDSLVAEGYQGFTKLSKFLSQKEREIYMKSLHSVLLLPLQNDVQRAVLKSFHHISAEYPSEVDLLVLHKDDISDNSLLDNYLNSMGSIVNLKFFEEYVTDTLIYYSTKKNLDSSMVALKHLNRLLTSEHNPNLHSLLIKKDFLTQLLQFLEQISKSECMFTDEYLISLKMVIQNIIRALDVELQKVTYLTHVNKHFGREDVFMAVLAGLITPLKVGVFDDYERINVMLNYAVNASNNAMAGTAAEVLGTVFNKLQEESVLQEKLLMAVHTCEDFDTNIKIQLMSWITKGLITRNHSMTWQCNNLLMGSLHNNKLEAAEGIRRIMDDDKVICKANGCQIMNLYKQKFFVFCINELSKLSSFNDAQLCAVGYLIEKAPKMAVIGSFEKIFRLILSCLENCKEQVVLEIILRRITELASNQEAVVQNHLEDILSRVLDLTIFESSMNVRIASIQFLKQIVSTYKIYQLLPFKQQVVNRLGLCVDDKKRLVRKEAMECRSMWYLLDAPI